MDIVEALCILGLFAALFVVVGLWLTSELDRWDD
jgi:hypothetical protein